MLFKFQLRRGTSSQWASVNPILSDGEPGIETDTKRFKLGDGTTPWLSLPSYLTDAAMEIYINEAVANANPIGQSEIDEIVDRVSEQFELPDLTLIWENAKA